MSQRCQLLTHAPQQKAPSFDDLVSELLELETAGEAGMAVGAGSCS
jgi:hypothetical protein